MAVTDQPADNLQRIGKIIATMDTPSGGDVEVIALQYAVAADLATMVYEYPRGTARANRIRAEFGMTVLNWMGRHYVGGHRKLARRVFFEHAAPEYAADYRRIFGENVVFGHPFTEMPTDASRHNPDHLTAVRWYTLARIRSLSSSSRTSRARA